MTDLELAEILSFGEAALAEIPAICSRIGAAVDLERTGARAADLLRAKGETPIWENGE